MELSSNNSLGLLGYIIIVNEEIHSRQIKWLERVTEQYEWSDQQDIIKNILNDTEEKISFNDSLNCYFKENRETKELIYRICFQLAIIDQESYAENKPDSQEEKILKSMETEIGNSKISVQRKQAIKGIDQRIFQDTGNDLDSDSFELDYKNVLEVAKEDYRKYEVTFKCILSECKKLASRLEIQSKYTKNPALKKEIEDFLCEYRKNVIAMLLDLKESSVQKELAVHGFSIALMGRTKAGKSTLHYIMCNEGKEFIGKGAQRTTRFNRVFNWNRLKIIDTPGIGAGEEQGRKDEKIALRVLAQVDIVCFILVDDTIQSDVLGLLDKIAKYHKPMLVVLNHKEDIRKKSHMKTFMSDPDHWRITDDESNLNGYINRLIRNAEKNGYEKLMTVIPVFLLAAQLGKEKRDDVMYDASNYPAFIENIRKMVRDNSLIYKSQTMLDEPSVRLHIAHEIIKTEEKKIQLLYDKVLQVRERIEQSTAFSKEAIKKEIIRSIKMTFEDFYTEKSYVYVEENYKEKDVFVLNNAYNNHLKECGLENKIKDIMSDYLSEYQRKISEMAKEIDEEISYAAFNVSDLFGDNRAQIKGGKSTFSLKGLFKGASIVLDGIAYFYPAVAIVSLPLSVFSSFMKTKEEKTQIAKDTTLENFNRLYEYSKNQVVNITQRELEKFIDGYEREISQFFNLLTEQIEESKKSISDCQEEFYRNLKRIDRYLAYRILQYTSTGLKEFDVVDTQRDLKNNKFTIKIKRPSGNVEFDMMRYRKISTEKIQIKFID